jgi:hypothetical protein
MRPRVIRRVGSPQHLQQIELGQSEIEYSASCRIKTLIGKRIIGHSLKIRRCVSKETPRCLQLFEMARRADIDPCRRQYLIDTINVPLKAAVRSAGVAYVSRIEAALALLGCNHRDAPAPESPCDFQKSQLSFSLAFASADVGAAPMPLLVRHASGPA